MARSPTTQSLYLQIGANADDLTRVAKAARLTLADLGAASGDLQKTMADNFRQLGGNEVAQSARQIEATYRRTFANIRAAAEETLSKPVTAVSIVGGNISGAQAQLATARATAAAYQELADAQTRLVQSSGGVNAGERELATVLTGQALAAKESVVGLEQQLTTLRALRGQLGVTTDAEEEATASHNRMGAAGMIAEHVVRSFSDSVAAGQSPVRALTMEMGRITEAMTLYAAQTGATEGAMGKFATFMGGRWGLAISVGVAVLVPLVQHMFESADATDDAKRAADEYAKAQDNFADAIDKANGKLVERNRLLTTIALQEKAPEIEKQETAASDFSKQAFGAASAGARRPEQDTFVERGQTIKAYDPATVKAITDANGDVIKLRNNLNELAKTQTGDARKAALALANQVNHLAGQFVFAKQQAEELRGKAGEVATALRGGTVLTTGGVQRAIEEKNATTPLEKAQIKVRELNDQKADIDAMPYGPAQQSAVKKWGEELDTATAAVKRLQAAQKDSRDGRQIGRQIDLSQAEEIVRGIGGRVTSSYRSTAQQQVLYNRYLAGTGSLAAKPGTSEHERGQALDVAKTAGVSMASLKKAFEDAGVHLTEALDEGNHYHVAWGAKGPSADALARRQQAGVRKDANDDRAFQGQMRQAQDAYAQAMLGLGATTEQRYQVAVAQLRGDLALRDKQLDDQVTAGSLSAAEALQLMVIYGMTEQLQEQKAKRDEMTSLLDQQLSAQRAQIQSEITLLQLRQQGAVGRAAQFDLAQQALAKQQEAERDAIAQRINNAASNPEDAARAVQESQNLPQIQAQQRANLAKQYQGPLANYRDQLKANVGNMGDAIQGVEVDGLKGIEDGLLGIANKSENAKQALHNLFLTLLTDLEKLAIEKGILALLGGGSGGGGSSSGGGFGDELGSILKGVFGGGKASGGGVDSKKWYVVGEHGPEIFAPGVSGSIIPNHAINDNPVPAMATLSSTDMRAISSPRIVVPAAQVTIRSEPNDRMDTYVVDKAHGVVDQRKPELVASSAAAVQDLSARRVISVRSR